jgi:glycosyltransferase involved in cell wall biosynthesis
MNITWSCSLDASGYSSCARDYVKSLYRNDKCDVNFIINNVARNINAIGIHKEELEFFSKIAVKSANKNSNLVAHSVPDRMVFGNNREILYTVCETEISKRWVKICNKCDIVMTASNFCKEKMIESGCRDNIHVISHTYNPEIWNSQVKPLFIGNLKKYNFLTVADFTPRKNCEMLIKSFLKTFEGNKNVSLTIKAYFNSFDRRDQIKLVKKIRRISYESGISDERRPTIYFYGEPIPENLMPRFMNSFDCLVSPHRGEGYGLTLSQMASLGKPVLSTNYSGGLDFLNEENSFLIDTNGFEPVCEEMLVINPNYEGMEWIKVDKDSLCDKLRYIYNNQDKAKKKGLIAEKEIKEKTSYDVVSNKIIEL